MLPPQYKTIPTETKQRLVCRVPREYLEMPLKERWASYGRPIAPNQFRDEEAVLSITIAMNT